MGRGLNVESLGEQIDHGDPLDFVARRKCRQVARQGSRIAGDDGQFLRAQFEQACCHRLFKTCPGRVQQNELGRDFGLR